MDTPFLFPVTVNIKTILILVLSSILIGILLTVQIQHSEARTYPSSDNTGNFIFFVIGAMVLLFFPLKESAPKNQDKVEKQGTNSKNNIWLYQQQYLMPKFKQNDLKFSLLNPT